MANFLSINLITTDSQVRSGRPCLIGTGIEVTTMAIEHIFNGRTPLEIAADYRLPLSHVHAALAYYYEHKTELDDLMRKNDELAEAYRQKQLGNRRPPLTE